MALAIDRILIDFNKTTFTVIIIKKTLNMTNKKVFAVISNMPITVKYE